MAVARSQTQGQAVQAVRTPSNVPKVSSARVITSQKPNEKSQESVLIQISGGHLEGEEIEESEEGYADMEGGDFQYEEEEEEEESPEDWAESEDNTPSSSQPSTSKVKMAKVVPKENTSLSK